MGDAGDLQRAAKGRFFLYKPIGVEVDRSSDLERLRCFLGDASDLGFDTRPSQNLPNLDRDAYCVCHFGSLSLVGRLLRSLPDFKGRNTGLLRFLFIRSLVAVAHLT